ncbi:MAG: hypothetical protein ACK56F_13810, partial [bacterium]
FATLASWSRSSTTSNFVVNKLMKIVHQRKPNIQPAAMAGIGTTWISNLSEIKLINYRAR